MIYEFKIYALLFVSVVVLGCGGSSGNNSPAPENQEQNNPEAPNENNDAAPVNELAVNGDDAAPVATPEPLNEQAQEVVDSLYGSWKSECIVFEYQGVDDSMFSEMTLKEDGTLDLTIHHFRDEACAGIHWQDTVIKAFVVDGDVVAEPADAKAVDYTLQSLTLIPIDLRNTLGMKRAEFCGQTDWKRNIAYDMTGRTCQYKWNEQFKEISFPAKGSVKKDIYKIDGKTMRFGLEVNQIENGLSAERPTKFNDLIFHRQ